MKHGLSFVDLSSNVHARSLCYFGHTLYEVQPALYLIKDGNWDNFKNKQIQHQQYIGKAFMHQPVEQNKLKFI